MIPQNISLCIPFLCGLIVISSAARLDGAQQSVAAAPASTGFIDVDGASSITTQYFLDRGKEAYGLLQKGDVKGAISEWSEDRFLIGPQNDGARRIVGGRSRTPFVPGEAGRICSAGD
jgi:hypothetical protein